MAHLLSFWVIIPAPSSKASLLDPWGALWENGPARATRPKADSTLALYVGLAIQAAGIVWWASNLTSQVQHNDFQIQMMARDVEKHAIFVRDWPSGKYGSGELPSDTRQDLHISELQRHLETLMEDLYTLKTTRDK